MLDVILVGVMLVCLGTGLHYIFAPQFAARYGKAFNVQKVMQLAPQAIAFVKPVIVDCVRDGVMQANEQILEANKGQVIREEMSERGKAGAEARQVKKMEKDAMKAMVMQQIEQRYPGASAFMPQLKEMLGFDPLEYAAKNPGAAMALLDKFLGKGGMKGQPGGGQDWVVP